MARACGVALEQDCRQVSAGSLCCGYGRAIEDGASQPDIARRARRADAAWREMTRGRFGG